MNFNFNNPDIQDVRVRQAIIKSINREEIAQDLMQGTATPATSMQTPGNTGYDPEFIDYEYDPQAARELLVEAGYDEGIEMVFQTSVDGSGQLIPVPIAERIQSDLAASESLYI
ncbi:oligopeptide ABC transporter, periplasmic oligopeptide-binding protein OppA [Geomicrobium sp. JCM 19037]|nr:oligopeptide ABC transporter, periplasmic oligopeptide-binding protein OppA [Geomicrobium sp. JCM 19037]